MKWIHGIVPRTLNFHGEPGMLKCLVGHQQYVSEWPTELKIVSEVACQTIVKLSPKRGYVATGASDGTLMILEPDTWSVVFRYKYHAMPIVEMNWSENGEYIITISADWQVCVWNTLDRRVVSAFDLDFNPASVSFDIGQWNKFAVSSGNYVYSVIVDSEKFEVSELGHLEEEAGEITSIECMKEGMVACGTTTGSLYLINRDGSVLLSLHLCNSFIRNTAYCHFANILAVSCNDKSVRTFYLEEYKDDLSQLEVGHRFTNAAFNNQWNGLTFSRDGDYLYAASAANSGTVCIWHTFAKVEMSQLKGSLEPVTSLFFDISRVMLAGVGIKTGKIYVWRAEPVREWDKILYKFAEINKGERLEIHEKDWDVPDLRGDIKTKESIDIWECHPPNEEVIIPYDI